MHRKLVCVVCVGLLCVRYAECRCTRTFERAPRGLRLRTSELCALPLAQFAQIVLSFSLSVFVRLLVEGEKSNRLFLSFSVCGQVRRLVFAVSYFVCVLCVLCVCVCD